MYTRIYDGSLLFVEGCLIWIWQVTNGVFFFFWRGERQFLLSREEKRIIYMELLEVMYKTIGIMDSTFLKIVCKYWGTINLCYWLWTVVNKYKKYRSQPSKYNIDTYQYWSNNYIPLSLRWSHIDFTRPKVCRLLTQVILFFLLLLLMTSKITII